jgi:hypothetical protein
MLYHLLLGAAGGVLGGALLAGAMILGAAGLPPKGWRPWKRRRRLSEADAVICGHRCQNCQRLCLVIVRQGRDFETP